MNKDYFIEEGFSLGKKLVNIVKQSDGFSRKDYESRPHFYKLCTANYEELETKLLSKLDYIGGPKNTLSLLSISQIVKAMKKYFLYMIEERILTLYRALRFYLQLIWFIEFIDNKSVELFSFKIYFGNSKKPLIFYLFPSLVKERANLGELDKEFANEGYVYSLIDSTIKSTGPLPGVYKGTDEPFFVPLITKKGECGLHTFVHLILNGMYPIPISTNIEKGSSNKLTRSIAHASLILSIPKIINNENVNAIPELGVVGFPQEIYDEYSKIIKIEDKDKRQDFIFILYEKINGSVDPKCDNNTVFKRGYRAFNSFIYLEEHRYSDPLMYNNINNVWRKLVLEYCVFMGKDITSIFSVSIYNLILSFYCTCDLSIADKLEKINKINNVIKKSNKKKIVSVEEYTLLIYLLDNKEYDCLIYIGMYSLEDKFFINVNRRKFIKNIEQIYEDVLKETEVVMKDISPKKRGKKEKVEILLRDQREFNTRLMDIYRSLRNGEYF